MVGDLFDLELKGSVTTNFQGVHKKNPLHGVVLLDYNLQAVQQSKSLSSITASYPSQKQIQLIAMNETRGQSKHKCTDCVQ